MTYASSKGIMGFEIVWVFLVLIIVGLGLIYGYSAFSELNDDIQSDTTISSVAKDASQTTVGNFASNWDNIFLFLFIMLWALILVVAFFGTTNPVFMAFSMILIIFGLIVIMLVANTYKEATELDEVSTFAQEFPKTNWILEHSVLTFALVGFSMMLVLYGRSST